MTLEEYRAAFKKGDNKPLETIFNEEGKYCVQNLQRKMNCSEEEAKDAFIEAVMIFRERILNGKLTELTKLRNYLYAICINKIKEKHADKMRLQNHEGRIKDYFYDFSTNQDHIQASKEYQEDLFKQCLMLLEDLGDKCVALLKAFYVYNELAEEITEDMGFSSIEVTRSSKSRCLKKWRQRIFEAMKEKQMY